MNIKTVVNETVSEVRQISTELKEIGEIKKELFKVEAAEYSSFLKKKLVAGVALGLFAFFLLCVLLFATISAIGIAIKSSLPEYLQPYSWHLVASAVSLFFLLVIVILLSKLKKKPATPFFSHSIQELKNDRVWLKSLKNPESSNS